MDFYKKVQANIKKFCPGGNPYESLVSKIGLKYELELFDSFSPFECEVILKFQIQAAARNIKENRVVHYSKENKFWAHAGKNRLKTIITQLLFINA